MLRPREGTLVIISPKQFQNKKAAWRTCYEGFERVLQIWIEDELISQGYEWHCQAGENGFLRDTHSYPELEFENVQFVWIENFRRFEPPDNFPKYQGYGF